MKRAFVLLPLFVGFAGAELNVGDQVTVPITVMMLNITRDYPSTVPATVQYKDNDMYILTVPKITYIMHKDKPTLYLDTTMIPQYTSQLSSLFPQVKSDVLNYFGLTEDDLFDSDNDSRIYFIIAPLYITDNATSAGIYMPNTVTAFFDPHYSIRTTTFPRHEIIYLNSRSILTGDSGFDPGVLRKVLYIYYTAYVLWSMDLNETPGDLMRLAVYMASKIDTLSDYYTGQDTVPNIRLSGAKAGYDGNTFVYDLNNILAFDEINFELAYVWMYYLEETFGENAIESIAVSPDFAAAEIAALFESNGMDFKDAVADYYLKAILNGKGFGSEYDFTVPALAGKNIFDFFTYPNRNTWYVLPYQNILVPDSMDVVESWGMLGIGVRNPAITTQPVVLNYPDNLYIRSFLFDIPGRTVTEITSPDRLLMLNMDSTKVVVVMNLNTATFLPWLQYGDSTPPVIERFFVNPNVGALNVFDIYLQSDSDLCVDANNCKAGLSVTIPGAPAPVDLLATKIDAFEDDEGSHRIYFARLEIPVLRTGEYIFALTDIADSLDNRLHNTPAETLYVQTLNTAQVASFYGNSVKVRGLQDMTLAIFREKTTGEISISSNRTDGFVDLYVAASSNKVIYRKLGNIWVPVDSRYVDGYVVATVDASGIYRLGEGNPNMVNDEISVSIVGKRLILNMAVSGKFHGMVYSSNGRLVKSFEIAGPGVVSVDLSSVSTGIYKLMGEYEGERINKTIVVY